MVTVTINVLNKTQDSWQILKFRAKYKNVKLSDCFWTTAQKVNNKLIKNLLKRGRTKKNLSNQNISFLVAKLKNFYQ